MAAERIRQGGLDREAQALNDVSRDRYNDFEGQQGDKASELGQYFTDQKMDAAGANEATAAEQVVPQSGSALTVREESKQRGKATDFTNTQGEQLGKLRAFGDVLGGISREQARDAGTIGQIGGFKRGSSNIIPLELEQANQAGAGLNMLGDILGLGGSFAVSKGLGGSMAPTVSAGARATAGTGAKASGLLNLYGRT